MELAPMPKQIYKDDESTLEAPVAGKEGQQFKVSRLDAMKKLAELRDELMARDGLEQQVYKDEFSNSIKNNKSDEYLDDSSYMRGGNNDQRRELIRKINILESAITGKK
jgi:hypothetical protein